MCVPLQSGFRFNSCESESPCIGSGGPSIPDRSAESRDRSHQPFGKPPACAAAYHDLAFARRSLLASSAQPDVKLPRTLT